MVTDNEYAQLAARAYADTSENQIPMMAEMKMMYSMAERAMMPCMAAKAMTPFSAVSVQITWMARQATTFT